MVFPPLAFAIGLFKGPLWSLAVQYQEYTARKIFVATCGLVTMTLPTLFFAVKDWRRDMHGKLRYKESPPKWPSHDEMLRLAFIELFPIALLNIIGWSSGRDGTMELPADPPSLAQFFGELYGLLLVGDALMYLYHAWAHKWAPWRRAIHDVHHTFQYTHCLGGIWVHPVEDLIAAGLQV